jgi:uncharacterized protein
LQWIWDEEKSRINKRKHGLSFEAAQSVFSDPLAISRIDSFPEEERWQTIERSPHFVNGLIGQLTIFVVHTWSELDPATGLETGRIISARKATIHERRTYEEGTF